MPAAAASAAAGWLGTLFTMASRESRESRAGWEDVLARTSELMFVETFRWYLETLPAAGPAGWPGCANPIVGQALQALHGRTAEAWTVERLAREAGVSRSVLAERFTAMAGQPPIQYLAWWRMQRPSRRLIDGESMAATADAVGDESDAAFSRAFKKLVGLSPAAWRQAAARSTP